MVYLPYPSEKYDIVSWDDEIPNILKNKIRVPNHQPVFGWLNQVLSPLDHHKSARSIRIFCWLTPYASMLKPLSFL